MIIKDFNVKSQNGFKRISAVVCWEDCGRDKKEIYFETEEKFAGDFNYSPEAFIVAGIVPAIYFGEKRIKIDDEISRLLCEGLKLNMRWFIEWYGRKYRPVEIEAKIRDVNAWQKGEPRVGLFLSGGVDSLFSLRKNRLCFPLAHPGSIKDCILIHGFDMGTEEGADEQLNVFARAKESLETIAKETQVELISVKTNVRHINSETSFWTSWFHGAALSSVAHFFSPRISKIIIASTDTIENFQPWGSHPLLDSNYSSLGLEVVHDRLYSRLEKTRVLSGWPTALENLRVCHSQVGGLLNCGKCEKCIKTMAHLLAVGKLKSAKAFPVNDLTPALLKKVKKASLVDYRVHFEEIIGHLEAQGRHDLVKVIRADLGWKGSIMRFDNKYLNGVLTKLWEIILTIKRWFR